MTQLGSDKLIEKMILKTAEELSGYFLSRFGDSVAKRELVSSGDFEKSFTYEAIEREGGVVISISFNYYGNILTRSKVFWTKPANGHKILEWVKRVGVDYFSYVPGYDKRGWVSDSGKWGIDDEKAAERIAAAISFQRVNGSQRLEYGKMRARNWKRKPWGTGRAYVNHLIAERVSEVVKSTIKNSIEGGG